MDSAVYDLFNKGNISTWHEDSTSLPAGDGVDSPIARFFGSGTWLVPINADDIKAWRIQVRRFLNRALLSFASIGANHYILVDSHPNCSGKEHACTMIDGLAHTLERPGKGHSGSAVTDPNVYTEVVPQADLKGFELEKADISVAELIRHSVACQRQFATGMDSWPDYSLRLRGRDFRNVAESCVIQLPVICVERRYTGSGAARIDARKPSPCRFRLSNSNNLRIRD